MIPQPIDTIPLFQRLTEEERQLVTTRLKRRQAAPNELIISEGQAANTMFIISSGWVKLESNAIHQTLANLSAGSLIGELDMLQRRTYSMTARAAGTSDTQLLTLSRTDLEDLINECPSIGLKFSANMGMRIAFLENYLVQHRLRHIDLLSALSESDLRAIAQRLDFRHCDRSQVIIDAGQAGEAAFFVEEGRVRLITKTKEGESFEDLQEGAIFGHTALLTSKPYTATARAVTDVTLWVLPRAAYLELLREHPSVKLALSRALAESISANDQTDAVERMRQLHLFNDVPTDALSVLTSRLVMRHFPANEVIYAEGTPGDAMYIVDSGQVRLMDSSSNMARLLERIQPGGAFGEMALLTGRTRGECARAASDSTLWVLYKTDFDEMLVQYPEISLSLSRALSERLTKRESDFVIRHMRRIKLFADLAGSELDEISKRVHGLRFRPGEIVCFAGQPSQTLYLIEKGQIKRMTTGPAGEPIMLDILEAGDSFGDQEIVQNQPYYATAQTLTDTELWTISKTDFMAMMQSYPALSLTVTRLMAERLSHAQNRPPMQPRPRPTGGVPPRPPAARPPSNTQQPPRIQRPPSGARPIKSATPVAPKPQQTAPIVTPKQQPPAPPKKQTSMNSVAAPTVAPKPAAKTHLQAPHLQAPKMPHLQAPHFQTPQMPHLHAPEFHRPHKQAAPRGKSFFAEFGDWAHGLSLGAKLRALTLGLLATWFVVIAGPFTTFTAVSSAVGGLQLSNGTEAVTTTQADIVGNPFGNSRNKIANAVPTNTPIPTRTPQPTFTPKPKPTLAPATRTPAPVQAAAAAVPPTAVIPALPPRFLDPRLGNGPQVLPHLEGVRVIEAPGVARGQKFWRVTSLKFEDIAEANNDHTIYVKIFDEGGKRAEANIKWWGNGSGDQPAQEQKSASDICDCNYGLFMFGDGYGVKIDDKYPSDQVVGMIMPMKRHVNYKIQFQLTTNP
ncbi:MAG: cyclic nucleotide-binding domain-containing protein [Chloroflexi bacterium]|nr:cyclic nucleotide-binding domain-containing protein [Chloroflexota bacterium]